MKRMIFLCGCILLASTVLLSSCIVPEKFDATLNIDKSGAYAFEFDGTLIGLGFEEARDELLINEKAPQRLKELEEKLKEDPNYKEISYAGKGRFKVRYRQEGVIKPESKKIELLYIDLLPMKPDQVLVKGANLEDNETIAYMKKLNVQIAGKLTVTTNARVIRHNADRSPWLFGLLGEYEWQFSLAPFPEPWMFLELK